MEALLRANTHTLLHSDCVPCSWFLCHKHKPQHEPTTCCNAAGTRSLQTIFFFFFFFPALVTIFFCQGFEIDFKQETPTKHTVQLAGSWFNFLKIEKGNTNGQWT